MNSKKKDECKEELNEILEVLCCSMLLGYLYEVEHPEEYSILHRIMTPASSEKVFCYCTLEDAMNDKN